MQSSSTIVLMAMAQLLPLFAYVAAGIYAIVQRKRHPTASRLVLLAVVVMTATRILGFLTPVLLTQSVAPARLAVLLYALNAGWALLNLVAFGLLIAAVFAKRLPESHVNSESGDAGDMPTSPPAPSRNPYESPQ